MDVLILINFVGTVAFAVSGAMVAIDKKMDIFGVNILALTTAVGGGAIRDLLINNTPPIMFRSPEYVYTALITANIVFAFLYFKQKQETGHKESMQKNAMPYAVRNAYLNALFISDTLGLAAFTMSGVHMGMNLPEHTTFLVIFLGVITGVGGGVLRDVLAGKTPEIFVQHIYAVASLAGAVLMTILWPYINDGTAMILGCALIVVIRGLAAKYKWNLPKIERKR